MIYENICKLAKERGISINKLEEKANVSTGSICKWGNSVSPTVKNIKKVCSTFGRGVESFPFSAAWTVLYGSVRQ